MAEKTEAPTGKRISEARKKGEVARSVELNTAAILLASVILLKGPGQSLVNELKNLVVISIASLPTAQVNEQYVFGQGSTIISSLLPSMGLILVILLLTGSSVTLLQTNFLWASDKLKPDLNRLNFLKGFKRLFSSKGLIELGRATLKLFVVGYFAYDFLQGNIPAILQLGTTDLTSGLSQFVELATGMAFRIAGAYIVLAALDYIYQRWTYMRGMKMTKEEIKEENKQQEGDPFIKSRIRGMQRRMARMHMMQNVHKATAIITNPTHLAIAIEYDSTRMNAPRVLAKGAHLVAQRIVAIAKENNIPIVQNIPLAHAIYDNVAIDQEIPPELYTAMAEILAYVYRLQKRQTAPATA